MYDYLLLNHTKTGMGKYDFELDMYDENTISWIANQVKENTCVLEFGPANGRLTKYLNKKKNCTVDIVEIDEESGEEAAQYADIALIGDEKGDIEKYYWAENGKKYDYIIFADVLEHLVHADEVLKRCRNVLKEKGNILVSVPNIAHNSIIIELFNDEFQYNPTGILDNTHVRFFTRNSFERMAGKAGWAVIGERAKRIRVGETEIKNSFANVPKEVAKELLHRPQGDIYQYMFVLALSTEYLTGNWQRTVSLDSTSHYFTEILFENNGIFDYRKSADAFFDPYDKNIKFAADIPDDSASAVIHPINCNCVLENIEVIVEDVDGVERKIEFESNGKAIAKQIYFLKENPEVRVKLEENDKKIKVEAHILKYDFEDPALEQLLLTLNHEQEHVKKVCADYDRELERRNVEFDSRTKQLCADYDKELERRNNEFECKIKQICADYEKELERRENAYKEQCIEAERRLTETVETYEKEIQRRENERLAGKK